MNEILILFFDDMLEKFPEYLSSSQNYRSIRYTYIFMSKLYGNYTFGNF